MRRLVAALLVALLALSLSGCGGGGEKGAGEAEGAAAAPAPAPAPDPSEETVPIADRSESTSETFEPMPDSDAVPEAVKERLSTKQPMLIFFYNSGQAGTDDLRGQVNKVVADNRGLIDLITYDLGKSTSVDAQGQVQVDDARLRDDANGQQAASFAREMGVDHLPYIVVVDDQGYRIFWSRGLVDAERLEREVQRASR